MIGEDLIKDLKDADREMKSKGLHNGCIIVDDSLRERMSVTHYPGAFLRIEYIKYLKGFDYFIFINREAYNSIVEHFACLIGRPASGLINFLGLNITEVGRLRELAEFEASIDSGALSRAVIGLAERVGE